MRFFRRRSSPALVILLALAMQAVVVLAHAHVHPHPPVKLSAQGTSASMSLACRALVRPATCAPVVPSEHHDDCPLCWSLAASGSGVLPAPMALAAVALPSQTLRPPTVVAPLAIAETSQFQARGPPRA